MALKNQIRQYLDRFPFLKQLIKFCIVGGTSAIINFGILLLATEWAGLWYITSAILGFVVSATFNFLSNKFWTFRNSLKGRAALTQVAKFSIVITIGLVVNTIMIYYLTEDTGLDYRLSWVFATAIVTFWNFGFNRFWTFKHQPNLSL